MEIDPLEEIRQIRDQIARESDYDVKKMMELRAREKELAAQGVKFVSFAKKAKTESD